MEIEYSNELKGKIYAYRFTAFEEKHIADSLQPVVKKFKIKIHKILNHPKNEGQAKYSRQIDVIRGDIKSLEYIIRIFSQSAEDSK